MTMQPDTLIRRERVMGILNIKTQMKFRELLRKGLIPPAIGCYKKEQVWSNSIVQEYRRHMEVKEESFSNDLMYSVCIDGFTRLMDAGSMVIEVESETD